MAESAGSRRVVNKRKRWDDDFRRPRNFNRSNDVTSFIRPTGVGIGRDGHRTIGAPHNVRPAQLVGQKEKSEFTAPPHFNKVDEDQWVGRGVAREDIKKYARAQIRSRGLRFPSWVALDRLR